MKATEVLKTFMGSEVGNSLEVLVPGNLPPEVDPTPPPSPTEQQRVHRYGVLLEQEARLLKGAEEGRVRVERARTKVQEEEDKLEKIEKELEGFQKQIEAHRVEEKQKEKKRRSEAKEAKGPLIEEVGSDMEVTEDGGEGNSAGEGERGVCGSW